MFIMKKLVWVILFILLLSSCGPDKSSSSNKTQWSSQTAKVQSWENPFGSLATNYLQDENFVQCAQQSVDQCILSTVSPDTPMSIEQCDDLMLESNKDSCKQWIITTQARESGDISLCSKLTNPDSCKYEILVAKWITDKTLEGCSDLSEEFSVQCNNTISRSLTYSELDSQWCDTLLVEIEGDDINTIKEDCKRDIEQAKIIEAEIAEQQAIEDKRLEEEQAEQQKQQALEEEKAQAELAEQEKQQALEVQEQEAVVVEEPIVEPEISEVNPEAGAIEEPVGEEVSPDSEEFEEVVE